MSEARLARGILVAHGTMAAGIIDAVRSITGAEADVLVPLSNKGLSPQTLAQEVRKLVGDEPTILFTDLQSGSCGFAARLLARELPDLVIVSGVNLPVLLEFVTQRHLPLNELVPRLLKKGRSALGCAPETLETNADRAVSGG